MGQRREELILSKVRKMRKERNKKRRVEDEVEEEKECPLENKSKRMNLDEDQLDRVEDLGDEDDEQWRKDMRDQDQLRKRSERK